MYGLLLPLPKSRVGQKYNSRRASESRLMPKHVGRFLKICPFSRPYAAYAWTSSNPWVHSAKTLCQSLARKPPCERFHGLGPTRGKCSLIQKLYMAATKNLCIFDSCSAEASHAQACTRLKSCYRLLRKWLDFTGVFASTSIGQSMFYSVRRPLSSKLLE